MIYDALAEFVNDISWNYYNVIWYVCVYVCEWNMHITTRRNDDGGEIYFQNLAFLFQSLLHK